MLKLENLSPAKGSNKTNSRVGRGQGSGGGGTAKRGHKGAKSRSGYSQKRGFEGGQMPLQRRVPKFGFKNINRVEYKAVNLDTLQLLADGSGLSKIDLSTLYNAGITAKRDLVKILGRGELFASIEVSVNAFSKSAIEAIEKAGGKAIIVEANTEVVSGDKIKLSSVTTKEVAKTEKKVSPKKEKTVEKEIVAEEEGVAKVTKEVSEPKVKKTTSKGDDLKKIEGIGPKIAELLVDAGIISFKDLSGTSVESLSNILSEAGSRYAAHNPTTWPEQAALAAVDKWDELKELQDKLNGGRPE
jgi:large subunit ribosomal protein L15